MSQLDFERDKLGYSEKLESMRHVQRLEAIEMGFVVTAYGVLIAGLLNAPRAFFESWGFWPLFVLPLVMAGLLFQHLSARRAGYFDRWKEFKAFSLRLFGRTPREPRRWSGFLMRLLTISSLTLSVVFVAGSLRKLSMVSAPVLLALAALLVEWHGLLAWEGVLEKWHKKGWEALLRLTQRSRLRGPLRRWATAEPAGPRTRKLTRRARDWALRVTEQPPLRSQAPDLTADNA